MSKYTWDYKVPNNYAADLQRDWNQTIVSKFNEIVAGEQIKENPVHLTVPVMFNELITSLEYFYNGRIGEKYIVEFVKRPEKVIMVGVIPLQIINFTAEAKIKKSDLSKEEFRNGSDLHFKDISEEQYRVYVFPDMEIKIENPLYLNVSASGGHRVFDSQGRSNYIPAGWRHLYWVVKEGKSHFAF